MHHPKFSSSLHACVFTVGLALALAACTRETGPPKGGHTPGRSSLMSARPFVGVPFTLAELSLEMQPIPAGTFRMGSPLDEPGRTAVEGPQTVVIISRPFWLGRTAVTHAQWRILMGTDLAAQARKAFPGNTHLAQLLAGADDNVAMHLVSWREAMAFCEKLNARAEAEGSLPTGYEFTLPTEAQWEYACRAGTTATYARPLVLTGEGTATVLDAIAWYAGNSSAGYEGPGWDNVGGAGKRSSGGRAGPRQVGLKVPNAWGLCDMLGNVYQWCRDFSSDALPDDSVTDPSGPAAGVDRIVRGGSWHSDATACRAAYRAWSTPDSRSQFIGFRLALAPKLHR